MTLQFTPATKQQRKLRLAIDGPAGSGKTYTALLLASELGKRVAMIDTERDSGLIYANLFGFDHLSLPNYEPDTFIAAFQAASEAEYDVVIMDSFSHFWEGVLALKDRLTVQSKSHDSFGVWRDVTPVHDALVDTMLRLPAHLIVTLRTKTAYDYEPDERTGRNKVVKVGTKPVAREGVEYEFDVVADMDLDLNFSVSKTRCPELTGQVFNKPGHEVADILSRWLSDGEPVAAPRDAAELKRVMDAIEPEDRRRASKQAFLDKFGRPEQLPAARLNEAKEFVAKFGSPPADGDKSSIGAAQADRPDAPVGEAGGEVSATSPPANPPPDKLRKRIFAECNKVDLRDDDHRHALIAWATNGATSSASEVTEDQVEAVITAVREYGGGGLSFVDEGQGIKVETRR